MKQVLTGIVTLVFAVSLTGGYVGPSGDNGGSWAGVTPAEARAISQSPTTRARIEGLRTRFVLPGTAQPGPAFLHRMLASTVRHPALGAGVARGFELREGHVRAVIPAAARQAASRTAAVALPVHANELVRLEDDTSQVAVSFTLRGASDAMVTTAGGIAMYAGALAGADVLHRVHAEGTEDYVVFEQRPARQEVAYDVDVSGVAGLRLVSNALEFLDKDGAPRLRVAPPYVVDAKGGRTEGVLAVDSCAFDVSPRAPWGREVTSPGASRCGVRVTWRAATYPAMVDPQWTATGSMVTARDFHAAATLGSGMVLVLGGAVDNSYHTTATAELYDPNTGAFAATGSMTTPRGWGGATFPAPTVLSSGQVLVTGGEAVALDDPTDDVVSSAELYDPGAGTFTATGSMTMARQEHTQTLLGTGMVLIAGGWNRVAGEITCVSSAELYDPTSGTFTATGSMGTARNHHTATVLGSGKVLIAGGGDFVAGTGPVVSSAELYDPAAGTFAATGSMTTARCDHIATLLGTGKVLVAGGVINPNDDGTSSADLYDPTTGTFAATGSMTTARTAHTATLLGTGEVLVAGGMLDGKATGDTVSSAEIYHPTAGTFAATTSMATVRYAHTATLLGSGEVLIAGGDHGPAFGFAPLSSAELFSCTTTCPASYNCGTVAACDGTSLDCGPACTAPETCGGGGTPNVCGCTPITTCPGSDNCGTVPDTCGGTVTCGTCLLGQTCTNNTCVPVGADAGSDSGIGHDAGKDSGTVHDAGTDSGTGFDAAKDSGSVHHAGKDSGTSHDAAVASDSSGNKIVESPSSGCSCRTAPRRDAPSYSFLWLGALGTRGRNSRRRRSRRCFAVKASPSAWTARAGVSTTSSSSGSGGRSSTRRCTCMPTRTWSRRVVRLDGTSYPLHEPRSSV